MINIRAAIGGGRPKRVYTIISGSSTPRAAIEKKISKYTAYKLYSVSDIEHADVIFAEHEYWQIITASIKSEIIEAAARRKIAIYIYNEATQDIVEEITPDGS